MATGPSSQARDIVREAFERLKASVVPNDARGFNQTTLRDVRDAALEIERQLAAKQELRNMRRLHPFLRGLEHYSKSIEVLCNGTPYLPWIWAPVKLTLQLSADYLEAFEKLIEAYGKIADAMPQFDRLSKALCDNHDFQAVLAVFYADILEFHRRAYKFVRRKSWKTFFSTTWAGFNSKFSSILSSLDYHRTLVHSEAASIDIAEARAWRERHIQEHDQREKANRAAQFHHVMTWLGLEGTIQQDEIDRIAKPCLPGSCDWLINHVKTQQWLQDTPVRPLIWLNGKPGAGKSVICSSLVGSMQHRNVFYYFWSYRKNQEGNSTRILRSLTSQIIEKFPHFAEYVQSKYVLSSATASLRALRDVLPVLLKEVQTCHLVIDGIDECETFQQKTIIEDVISLMSTDKTSHICKIFISTRDIPTISRNLLKKAKKASTISLIEESHWVNVAVERFVDQRLSEIKDGISDLESDSEGLDKIKHVLIEKANGMFLWVQLVLDSLENVYSIQDLDDCVKDLPEDLFEMYDRIFKRICNENDQKNREKGLRILRWISFSRRPLKSFELLSGVALSKETVEFNKQNALVKRVFEICKPLIEVWPDDTVEFVHFSVQEYLLKSHSYSPTWELNAHHDIFFACTTILTSGLDFLDPEFEEDKQLMRVCDGFCGLIPYANEYWFEHLLEYARHVKSPAEFDAIEQLSTQLCHQHHHISTVVGRSDDGTHSSDEEAMPARLEERLSQVAHLPVRRLIGRVLYFRNISSREACSSGKDAEGFALHHDPTLFSNLAYKFNSLIRSVLEAAEVKDITPTRLAEFKASYSALAFCCRYAICPDASTGFATEEQRDQHEKLHQKTKFCKVVSCSFNRVGFQTRKGFENHMRTYHSGRTTAPVPTRIRRPQNSEHSQQDHIPSRNSSSSPDREVDSLGRVRSSMGSIPGTSMMPKTPRFEQDLINARAYDGILTNQDKKPLTIKLKKLNVKQSHPGNWHESEITDAEDKKIQPPSAPASPLVNQIDERIIAAFPTNRSLDDHLDIVQCRHCRRPVLRTAAKNHIKECLDKKQAKLKKKKAAREARRADILGEKGIADVTVMDRQRTPGQMGGRAISYRKSRLLYGTKRFQTPST